MLLNRLLLVFGICLFIGILQAQDDNAESQRRQEVIENQEYIESNESTGDKLCYYDFTLNPSFPFNTFNDRYNGTPFGFSLAYSKQRNVDEMNFIGGQFSYAHLGSITTLFPNMEQRTGTNWMNFQFLYRHFPNFYFWKLEPFVEASLGPQWMYTMTTSTDLLDESTDFRFDESTFGLTYAVGVGFTIYIADGFAFLSKLNFTSSTSMTYLVPGEDLGGFPIENFTSESSPVNYFQVQFGVSYIY